MKQKYRMKKRNMTGLYGQGAMSNRPLRKKVNVNDLKIDQYL